MSELFYRMSQFIRAALDCVRRNFKFGNAPILISAGGTVDALYFVTRRPGNYFRAAIVALTAVFPINFFTFGMKTESNERSYF